MNTRLEIASRVLAGMLADSSNSTAQNETLTGWALDLADALIAAEERTRKPTTPSHGTIADYRIDVATAQAAYDANPSSKNASDLHAAKEALERRKQ